MPHRDHAIDEDALPVMVPRSERRLVATSAERIERLRAHITRTLRGMGQGDVPAPMRSEPAGFATEVLLYRLHPVPWLVLSQWRR